MNSHSLADLEKLLDVNFHRQLLSASISSLEEYSNPLAFNNFCAGFRELIRHILSHLAPDAEIKNCSWYIPEPTAKTGITRAHAISYVIQGGLSHEYVTDVLDLDVETERKQLLDAVNQLNKFTHVNESTFGLDRSSAQTKAGLAIAALIGVLTLANRCRAEIINALEEKIHDEVVNVVISETINSVDELATHHSIDNVDVEEVTITNVSSRFVQLQASGTLGVELQWGSNSDIARGDGAVLTEGFPFACQLQSSVESPEELEIVEGSFHVDTSSWWEGYYDE